MTTDNMKFLTMFLTLTLATLAISCNKVANDEGLSPAMAEVYSGKWLGVIEHTSYYTNGTSKTEKIYGAYSFTKDGKYKRFAMVLEPIKGGGTAHIWKGHTLMSVDGKYSVSGGKLKLSPSAIFKPSTWDAVDNEEATSNMKIVYKIYAKHTQLESIDYKKVSSFPWDDKGSDISGVPITKIKTGAVK